MTELRVLIAERIRANGPITVAEFMGLALYHPSLGYYARVSRRTGRAGDFFTSVDVGPAFGELLARQLAEMWKILEDSGPRVPSPSSRSSLRGAAAPGFDLVEAASGNGQLVRDILDAAQAHHADFYEHVRVHLVEVASAAREVQPDTLGPHASRLASSGDALPDSVQGVVLANELLDALPTHAVVMREGGLKEVFVDLDDQGGDHVLVTREMTPSTPEIARYLERAGARLASGWRAEVCLEAPLWIQRAAGALDRGFLLLLDYGHEAAELYSGTHSAGTLATFHRHTSGDLGSLLQNPGDHDITAHVDLTTVTETAERAGLTTIGRLDQTYFLLGLGLAEGFDAPPPASAPGAGFDVVALKKRLALKTLVLPGGLGSTLKVLIFGKGVGMPTLKGLSYRERLT